MTYSYLSMLLTGILLLTTGCTNTSEQEHDPVTVQQDKVAILATLNNETKAAFSRDYDLWTTYWVHRDDIVKTYINFADSTHSESVGWDNISGFVRNFIAAHPEPEPAPQLLDSVDIRLYGDGAWVSYEQLDSLRGRKRETRLMEKVMGQWKIAGMHTTIYGDTSY